MVKTFSQGPLPPHPDKYALGLLQMLSTGSYSDGINHVVKYKTHVMTKYMLLERLATALGL